MLRQDHSFELTGKFFQFHPQHVVQHASGDVLNLEVNPLCIIYMCVCVCVCVCASYGKLVFLHTMFIPSSCFPP
jgi:hypothetical protein